jgi:hypothetical protein
MQSNDPVFDAARQVAIQLRGPDGVKTVRVRFPSDDEWAERQRRRKVIVKNLGRGTSETTIQNGEEIDAAMLAKIRIGEEFEVDAFEAQKIIEQLATCEVDDVVLAGDAFRVTLRVLGATTTVLLKMPSAKDVNQYRRGFARVLDLPFNRQELTVNVRAGGDLYRKLAEATEGYAGDVPIIHQAVAVKAAIDALDASFQEDPELRRAYCGHRHRVRHVPDHHEGGGADAGGSRIEPRVDGIAVGPGRRRAGARRHGVVPAAPELEGAQGY